MIKQHQVSQVSIDMYDGRGKQALDDIVVAEEAISLGYDVYFEDTRINSLEDLLYEIRRSRLQGNEVAEEEEVEEESMVVMPVHYIGEQGLEVENILHNFIPRYRDAYVAHRIASALEYLLRAPLKNKQEDLQKAKRNIEQALDYIVTYEKDGFL